MKAIVIGGTGFVGSALCKRLKNEGADVVAVARRDNPALRELGITCVQHDMADSMLDIKEFEGADVLFLTAAKVSMWGPLPEFERINIGGTRNVIEACKKFGIGRLVYTSSPSVIADETDLKNVDESYPYPAHHIANYPATKMIAEKMVRDAAGTELKTVVLRPHLIYGPGDTNLVPTILEKARQGKLKQIGDGHNTVDFTHIDNCVEAHILAAKALESNPAISGNVYFITDGEPVNMWSWINNVLEQNGLPAIKKKVPYKLAYSVAALLEKLAKFGLVKEPVFTRFLISEMATDHYFNISAAKRDLGYAPKRY